MSAASHACAATAAAPSSLRLLDQKIYPLPRPAPPLGLGRDEVTSFLTHLAAERRVEASTQTLALAALLFLYPEVLGVWLPWLDEFELARCPRHVPVVLSPADHKQLWALACR